MKNLFVKENVWSAPSSVCALKPGRWASAAQAGSTAQSNNRQRALARGCRRSVGQASRLLQAPMSLASWDRIDRLVTAWIREVVRCEPGPGATGPEQGRSGAPRRRRDSST